MRLRLRLRALYKLCLRLPCFRLRVLFWLFKTATARAYLTRILLESARLSRIHARTYTRMKIYICIQEDMTPFSSSLDDFWAAMNMSKLMWTEDNRGAQLKSWRDIPPTVAAITQDDPYRSYSGLVRNQYGYVKCGSHTVGLGPCTSAHTANPPFLEFIWGDVLRRTIPV